MDTNMVANGTTQSEHSLLFKLVEAQIRGQGELKDLLDTDSIRIQSLVNNFFNLRPLALKWGPPTSHVEIMSVSNSNPQRFRIKRKSIQISPPTSSNDYSSYWNAISPEIGKNQGYKNHDGQNLGGRRTRFDLDVAPSGSAKENRILVIHFDKTGPSKQETRFFTDPINPSLGDQADLALMGYDDGEFGPLSHGVFAGAVFGDSANTIMAYCWKNAMPQPFALGISVIDKDNSSIEFETDIVIDPKVKNDG